jgi:hypothetical protein
VMAGSLGLVPLVAFGRGWRWSMARSVRSLSWLPRSSGTGSLKISLATRACRLALFTVYPRIAVHGHNSHA